MGGARNVLNPRGYADNDSRRNGLMTARQPDKHPWIRRSLTPELHELCLLIAPAHSPVSLEACSVDGRVRIKGLTAVEVRSDYWRHIFRYLNHDDALIASCRLLVNADREIRVDVLLEFVGQFFHCILANRYPDLSPLWIYTEFHFAAIAVGKGHRRLDALLQLGKTCFPLQRLRLA